MPYELIPMAMAAISAAVFLLIRGRGRTAFGCSLLLFAAVTLGGSMLIHNGEILYNAALGLNPGKWQKPHGAPQANLFGFKYDFRFYSLQLFGGVLFFWAARLAVSAWKIAGGSAEARGRAWKDILHCSLLVLPLAPMHIFAVATLVVMGIGSLGLGIARPLKANGPAMVEATAAA